MKKQSDTEQKIQSPLAQREAEPQAALEMDKETATADMQSPPDKQSDRTFPIVGIGASAGGLSAFEAFFSAMPTDTECGMAFVLVQHLSPGHKSILCELVQRYTRMQVFEVEDNMAVKPNCAYIIPPNRDMAFLNGSLQLLEPTAPRGLRLPIDFFFRSLAQDQRERAICIVLSGTGSDGTLGLRAVKGEGGMVMVQAPDSTQYDGMPRSAIATGLVDYILPPAEMPPQLIAYVTHAFGQRQVRAHAPVARAENTIKKICILLRNQTGHDFSQYKQSTVVRRVNRRMALHQIERPDQYLRFLQNNEPEIQALFRDLLIGVTSFFRDAEAFKALQTQVIPRLFANRRASGALRVWVCGCSTGEEAYSIAILIQEQMEALKQSLPVQVFATDIDPQAISQARGAVYPESIAADVSMERLSRFFEQEPNGGPYRIRKSIRDILVFSEQDVIKDPPFSKLDLISCRNLLIYMDADLQKKLIPLFHYALNPGGILFLGTSESVGEFGPLFAILDRKWKIYQRMEDLPDTVRPALGEFVPPLHRTHSGLRRPDEVARHRINFQELTEQALLKHYAQAGVLINGRGEILYIHGRTGKFLEPAPGSPGMNILSMAREGLQMELTTALRRAVTHKEPVRAQGLKVNSNGDSITADLTVRPVGLHGDRGQTCLAGKVRPAALTDLFLVVIEEGASETQGQLRSTIEGGEPAATDGDTRIVRLEQDLRAKEEYLQTTLEEMETANEELKCTNEELQSVNEELQSTNEELETSKEELQSINEELSTVNTELQIKVADLSRANNDMNNLLAGTGVGTLFLDNQLCIRRFTPTATQVVNLIHSDIGRPMEHMVTNLVDYDHLVQDVKIVLEELVVKESEVRTKSGAWYLISIRPYRTLENVIEGAVIAFVDITERKQIQEGLRKAQVSLAEHIVDTVREPLVLMDKDLRVLRVNRAFYSNFQTTQEETRGRQFYDLGDRQWDIPDLRRLLEKILPRNISFDGFEVSHTFEKIGQRTMLLNARRLFTEIDTNELILLAIEDITHRKPT